MAKTEKQPVTFSKIEICRNCGGRGYFEMLHTALQCTICEGEGRVKVIKEIKITIETIKS